MGRKILALQLHIVPQGSDEHRRHIGFQDDLCTHPATASASAALKIRLARMYVTDREAYSHAKMAFLREIKALALQETSAQSHL